MDITTALIALLIGLGVGAVILFTKMDKRETRAKWGWFAFALLAYALIAYAFVPVINIAIPLGGEKLVITEDGEEVDEVEPTPRERLGCVEDATVTLNSLRMYKLGTALSGTPNHRVMIDGGDKGLVAEDGTFTASAFDDLTIFFGENASGGEGLGYYTKEFEHTIGCTEGAPFIQTELCEYGNVTITIKLEDDSVMSGTNAEDLTTGDEGIHEFKIKAPNDRCAGPPYGADHLVDGLYGLEICFKYNNTEYTGFELQAGADTQVKKGYVPQALTAEAGYATECYFVEPTADNAVAYYTLITKTHATTYGGTTHPNATITVWDVDKDLDADTLLPLVGIQDEDNNDLGSTNAMGSATYYGK